MANQILTELNRLPRDPNPNQMYEFVTNVGPALHSGFDNGDFTGPQMESFSGMLKGIGYDLRNRQAGDAPPTPQDWGRFAGSFRRALSGG